MSDNPKMISQTTILSMGWTKGMIDRLLPEPTLRRNPHYASSSPMRLWAEADILAVMETEAYAAEKAKADRRKASAAKAVETKKESQRAEEAELLSRIKVKKVSEETIRKDVIAYQRMRQEKIEYYNPDAVYTDPEYAPSDVMERWIVNHIRHNLTVYDDTLGFFAGRVGGKSFDVRLKMAILDKIAETYPEHAEECAKQKTHAALYMEVQ